MPIIQIQLSEFLSVLDRICRCLNNSLKVDWNGFVKGEFMLHKSLVVLFRVLWGASVIALFFILPFWWVLGLIVFLALFCPLLAMALYEPFKKSLFGSPFASYVSGALEAVVVFLGIFAIDFLENAPRYLLSSAVGVYVTGFCSRVYKDFKQPPKKEEAKALAGFVFMSGVAAMAGMLFN